MRFTSLRVFLLACSLLGAPAVAHAQPHPTATASVKTDDLEGAWDVVVTSSNRGRSIPLAAIAVSEDHGQARIRIALGATELGLERKNARLTGTFKVPIGIVGGLLDAEAPKRLVELSILDAKRLTGKITGDGEVTRFVLTRRSDVPRREVATRAVKDLVRLGREATAADVRAWIVKHLADGDALRLDSGERKLVAWAKAKLFAAASPGAAEIDRWLAVPTQSDYAAFVGGKKIAEDTWKRVLALDTAAADPILAQEFDAALAKNGFVGGLSVRDVLIRRWPANDRAGPAALPDAYALAIAKVLKARAGSMKGRDRNVPLYVIREVLDAKDPVPAGTLTEKLLLERARLYIERNSGDGDEKIFPAIDSGEEGLTGYAALDRAVAERLIAFGKAFQGSDAQQKNFEAFTLDHAKHLVVAVRTSFDEESLFVAVIDRATGEGKLLGELDVVDVSYNMSQADFERILPGMGSVEDVDHYEVIDRLVAGARILPLGVEEVEKRIVDAAIKYWKQSEPVRYFASESEWQAWYNSTSEFGSWLYFQESDAKTVSFVLGRGDLWHEVIAIDRQTLKITITGEH